MFYTRYRPHKSIYIRNQHQQTSRCSQVRLSGCLSVCRKIQISETIALWKKLYKKQNRLNKEIIFLKSLFGQVSRISHSRANSTITLMPVFCWNCIIEMLSIWVCIHINVMKFKSGASARRLFAFQLRDTTVKVAKILEVVCLNYDSEELSVSLGNFTPLLWMYGWFYYSITGMY